MRQRSRQRGVIVVLAGVGLVIALAFIGLFADLGLAFVTKARLAKAVDAGALAAARNTALGNSAMSQLAKDVASANYKLPSGSYNIMIDTQSIDTTRVTLTATTETQTLLFGLLGQKSMSMRALGEATRFPLDLTLVLDTSLSLEWSNSFGDLQAAAKAFVARFDPNIDQVGLVSFSTVAKENVTIRKNFTSAMNTAIDALTPILFTNIDEGLRVGKAQLDSAPFRTKAIKVLVLFTDGLPTAFRDTFVMSGGGTYDGVLAVDSSGNPLYGMFDPVYGNPHSGMPSKLPPGNTAVTGPNALAAATSQAEGKANEARAAGYRVYCIGLGNLAATDPWDQPDLNLLKRFANDGGIVDATQPQGHMIFAPKSADLNSVFSQVADRILTRLTR